MAGMPRLHYTAWVKAGDKEPIEIAVDVLNPDRLVAEQSLARVPGLGGEAGSMLGLTMSTAWIWAAAKRQGLYSGELMAFLTTDCLHFDADDDDDAETDPTPRDRLTG